MSENAGSTNQYRKKFGEVAIELGFIKDSQVEAALAEQVARRASGRSDKLLGQILLELGHISPEQIQEVVDVVYPAVED